MLQCSECEFFSVGPGGVPILRCDPFSTIKEPDCLQKWQVVKLQRMVTAYEATLEYYRRLAPMQEKMFKHVERELEQMDESDKWRVDEDDDDEDDDDEDDPLT